MDRHAADAEGARLMPVLLRHAANAEGARLMAV
jgi:hypothetical protein